MTKWIAIAAGVVVLGGIVLWKTCAGDDGWPPHSGQLRQTMEVEVDGVRRGVPGAIELVATAYYTRGDADVVDRVRIASVEAITVTLVDAAGKATPVPARKWKSRRGETRGEIVVPEVPDGDYKLRVAYRTRLGPGTVDVALPLYTPARVHVITDRPLYEPGNLVRFRAVALRARDLAPLDGRPGRWIVTDPDGEVLLEEVAPAGDWGVVAGTFPLDQGATSGEWKVAWVSNDARDEVPFTVKPFTLPRFRVEAEADRPFYRPNDVPVVRGAVTYSSGAPVAGASLAVAWSVLGDWPPPTAWLESTLPKTATVGANGRFVLTLPEVPPDLQGQATLIARLAAVDAAGDRVEGSARVLLSEDGIAVSAVTEIGDGLVEGFNNRMYLRVTTPDGRVIPGAKIHVARAWQADDPGQDAVLDDDGVASVQLDPGPAVNVVIPARPYRPAPRPPSVQREETREVLSGEEPPLADQLEMDRWLAPLAACATFWVSDEDAAMIGVRVAPSGAVAMAIGQPAMGEAGGALAACAAQVVRGRRLPPGPDRLYAITFRFTDPDLPDVEATVSSAHEMPEGVEERIDAAVRRARTCLPRDVEGAPPSMLAWSVRAGSKEVTLGPWIASPGGGDARGALPCLQRTLAGARIALDTEAAADAIGAVAFDVSLPGAGDEERPQATTMLGYELLVSAELDGKPSTKLRVAPGNVPDLRLRVTPVLAKVGDEITAELIRGPNFAQSGRALPEELELTHLKSEQPQKAKLDDARRAILKIEPGTEGWVEIRGAGERALVYVRPENDLTVAVTPGQERYAPGQKASLEIETLLGGRGGPAAVGLFGVDASLGQLATLRDAGDLARVRPEVTTTSPAFGVLDGQALTLGRIRGAHAAAATILRVGHIPPPPALDAVVSARGETYFDPTEELTDRFYTVLAELHAQARVWERQAPAGEMMRPATMATLWKQALAACEKRGETVVDAFGRRLKLSRLPHDLLALTDPRAVVVVGTRLPEDVEDWTAWVRKEKP